MTRDLGFLGLLTRTTGAAGTALLPPAYPSFPLGLSAWAGQSPYGVRQTERQLAVDPLEGNHMLVFSARGLAMPSEFMLRTRGA